MNKWDRPSRCRCCTAQASTSLKGRRSPLRSLRPMRMKGTTNDDSRRRDADVRRVRPEAGRRQAWLARVSNRRRGRARGSDPLLPGVRLSRILWRDNGIQSPIILVLIVSSFIDIHIGEPELTKPSSTTWFDAWPVTDATGGARHTRSTGTTTRTQAVVRTSARRSLTRAFAAPARPSSPSVIRRSARPDDADVDVGELGVAAAVEQVRHHFAHEARGRSP